MPSPGNPEQGSRTPQGRYTRSPETARRDARCAEMFSDGHSYADIMVELGYKTRSSVYEARKRALREIVRGPAQRLLVQRQAELDLLWESAMEVLENEHVVVSNGRVVELNGSPIGDDNPKLQAIETLRKLNESMRKLHGTDQPAKLEMSGGVRYEVVGVEADDLT